ncbi:MAG: hypothetical protein SV760_06365, partial [Halobacteria archaeon]|nr:hypothetical protein [Halobacteria archaeon]
LVESHLRLNLLGFLGLTVMGAAYQFYPPNVGGFVGASRKSGFVSVALVGIGLTAEVLGLVLGVGVLPTAGRVVALVGSLVYAYLVLGLFFAHERE